MLIPEKVGKTASRFVLKTYFVVIKIPEKLSGMSDALMVLERKRRGKRPMGIVVIISDAMSSFSHHLWMRISYLWDFSQYLENITDTSASDLAWQKAYCEGNEISCRVCSLDNPVHACGECDLPIDKETCWKNEALCDSCYAIEASAVR